MHKMNIHIAFVEQYKISLHDWKRLISTVVRESEMQLSLLGIMYLIALLGYLNLLLALAPCQEEF